MAHHSVESNSLFLQKQNFLWMAQCCPAALISGQHLCHVHQRKMIVLVFQKTENTTLILVDYYSFFCYMQIFYGPLHTVVLIGSTINFKRFYQTKQCKEEKIYFIHTCAETGFRDTGLKGALPYRLLDRLKACNTVANL